MLNSTHFDTIALSESNFEMVLEFFVNATQNFGDVAYPKL